MLNRGDQTHPHALSGLEADDAEGTREDPLIDG
jgi:hypothetical protein